MEYKRYVHRNNHFLDFPHFGDEEVFMLVFDVSWMKEEELFIEIVEENKLKVNLMHGFRNCENISFSRNCTYVYTLPEYVQVSNLVAYFSVDDYLVIKEKKIKATENTSLSKENSYRQKFSSDRILKSPVAKTENLFKEENRSSNKSKENEENTLPEMKITCSSGIGEMGLERKSTTTSKESEENIMLEKKSISAISKREENVKKSINVLSDSAETVMQVKKDIPALLESEETIIQGKKCELNESKEKILMSESEEKIVQKNKSVNASSESNEEPKLEAKSMEASNILQTRSRLFPQRVHNQFNKLLSESDLRAAMNDIENRMKFINELIDKYCL